jgi:hypothetical protein
MVNFFIFIGAYYELEAVDLTSFPADAPSLFSSEPFGVLPPLGVEL